MRDHPELLLAHARQKALAWLHFDARHLRRFFIAIRQSLRNPAQQHAISLRALVKPCAAAMHRLRRGLLQQQGFLRCRRKHPPAMRFIDQRVVVEFRLKGEERKPEAILPRSLAVAAPGIATRLRQDRLDVIHKVQLTLHRKALHLRLRRAADLLLRHRVHDHRRHRHRAIALRRQPPMLDAGDARAAQRKLRLPRGIPQRPIAHFASDQKLHGLVRIGQRDFRRFDPDFSDTRRIGRQTRSHHDRQERKRHGFSKGWGADSCRVRCDFLGWGVGLPSRSSAPRRAGRDALCRVPGILRPSVGCCLNALTLSKRPRLLLPKAPRTADLF